MLETIGEKPYNGETLASIAAFDDIYQEKGSDASWVGHPLSIKTLPFLGGVLELSDFPHIIDLGGGEGSKAIKMYQIVRAVGRDATFTVIDASPTAIELGIQRVEELGLSSRINFVCSNVLDIDPNLYVKAQGVHEYQSANVHVPRKHHGEVARIIAGLVVPEGYFIANTFCKETTDFYGINVSKRSTGEVIGAVDSPIPGMYSYFPTEQEIKDTYSQYFNNIQIAQVPHPDPEKVGRYHFEVLMTRTTV